MKISRDAFYRETFDEIVSIAVFEKNRFLKMSKSQQKRVTEIYFYFWDVQRVDRGSGDSVLMLESTFVGNLRCFGNLSHNLLT